MNALSAISHRASASGSGTSSRPIEMLHLQPRHFAFMRAVIQGMDVAQSWERYLAVDGVTASASAQHIRHTVAWINDAFAAAARRHQRHGLARLIVLDLKKAPVERGALPTLAEFAKAQELENFAEAEQLDAYRARFGVALRRQGRRARLITRQLAALHWLEQLPRQHGAREDRLEQWLAPALATRLAAAGITRVDQLERRIAERGQRWWHDFAGIGPVKAARVAAQIAALAQVAAAPAPNGSLGPSSTDCTASDLDPARILPLQRLAAREPHAANAGNRGLRPGSRIAAMTDLEALRIWLESKRGRTIPNDTPAVVSDAVPGWDLLTRLSHTQRAYWKEAERFQLWLYLARGSSLSMATGDDCRAYQAFLETLGTPWCGRRAQRRLEPSWRPYAGPLSATARAFACTVLRGLYRYLVTVGYLQVNPWEGVPAVAKAAPPIVPDRMPHRAPAGLAPTCANRRLALALLLMRDSALPAITLVRLRTGDLIAPAGPGLAWHLRLPTAGRLASVPLGSDTVAALHAYLAARGIAAAPAAGARPAYLLGRASDARQRAPWAPCAREPFDPAAGIAAGTLRDQLRDVSRFHAAAGRAASSGPPLPL
jgi:hypothetical protein